MHLNIKYFAYVHHFVRIGPLLTLLIAHFLENIFVRVNFFCLSSSFV